MLTGLLFLMIWGLLKLGRTPSVTLLVWEDPSIVVSVNFGSWLASLGGERERGQCAFYRKVRGLEEEGEKRSNTQILRSWEKEPFSDDGRAWSDLSSSLSHLADNHSDMCCHNLHQEMRGNLAVPLFSCFFCKCRRWTAEAHPDSLYQDHCIAFAFVIHSPPTNRY